MKALTIWHLYARALTNGIKLYETRSWQTKYRGPVAIHTSMRPMTAKDEDLAQKYGIKGICPGKVVAIADLTDCILMDTDFIARQTEQERVLGNWQEGNYAWKFENFRRPEKDIYVSGRQGFWNLDMSCEIENF